MGWLDTKRATGSAPIASPLLNFSIAALALFAPALPHLPSLPPSSLLHIYTLPSTSTFIHFPGESLPVYKGVGSPVIGGTISTGATLLVGSGSSWGACCTHHAWMWCACLSHK